MIHLFSPSLPLLSPSLLDRRSFYFFRFFERYSHGNKPYYSAGLTSGALEHASNGLIQITPIIVLLAVEQGRRSEGVLSGSSPAIKYR